MSATTSLKNIQALIKQVDSEYGQRLTLIRRVVEEVNEILGMHHSKRDSVIKELKLCLAQKSLRYADFAKMVQKLLEVQCKREEEVRRNLQEFLKENMEVSLKLQNLLVNPDIKKFRRFVTSIQQRQQKREIKQGKIVEKAYFDVQSNMETLLEEFKRERISLNMEWQRIEEEKERLGLPR